MHPGGDHCGGPEGSVHAGQAMRNAPLLQMLTTPSPDRNAGIGTAVDSVGEYRLWTHRLLLQGPGDSRSTHFAAVCVLLVIGAEVAAVCDGECNAFVGIEQKCKRELMPKEPAMQSNTGGRRR